MIRLSGVFRSYHADRPEQGVLRGVELTVDDGEFVAVVGRSGSGKTTLLNIVAGLDTGYQGRVEVSGEELRSLSDEALSRLRNQSIGIVFQAFHLLDHLTAADNVALPAVFARPAATDDRDSVSRRARERLDEVGLGDRADARPSALSGGEKQRVALARALFHRPRLLLCDELTGNLDDDTGRAIIDVLTAVHRRDGCTVLVVTHDSGIVRVADRVLRLAEGQLAPDALVVREGAE